MTIPTVTEIRDQILADIQTNLGLSTPLLPRSTWGILATAVAGALALVYRFGAWARRQIFTATADADALVLRGAEYGLTRTAATRWKGTANAAGTDGTVIASGTLFQIDGTVYQTTSSTTISGTTEIELESLETGSDFNLDNGDTIKLVTPQTGVTRDATITATTQTAADQESLSAFRSRIAFRQANQPQGGAIADWVLWTTAVSGVAEAYIDRPSAGTITVYPIMDVDDPADRIPDTDEKAAILAAISDQRQAPIRAGAITVTEPTEVTYNVEIADLSPDDATTKDNINTAVKNYFYSRRPAQYTDEPDPKDTISAAQITRIVIEAGAEIATVTLKNAGGSSITDDELLINQLAALGNSGEVTWT